MVTSIYKEKRFCKDILVSLIFTSFIFNVSCRQKIYSQEINYSFESKSHVPDYSKLEYWAAHPQKYDPSDNVPKRLQKEKRDSLADVFFIYPTSYTDMKMPDGWNANIDDEELNKKTDNTSILYQASIFNKYCRVYSPRYRQANLAAFFSDNQKKAETALDTAYADVRSAFLFYLKNYNQGRPIIIASHSQGTLHAGRLLKEFFEKGELKEKLVAAYLIGLPVFKNYFNKLSPCHDSTETGCFVSWRTFEEGYTSPVVSKEIQNAWVTNPLTWTMDTVMAPEELNKGGVLRNFDKVIPNLVHAQVHGNVLWVNKPKFFGSIFLKTKNYHIADYNLFYDNIRQNVGVRIKSFLKKIN